MSEDRVNHHADSIVGVIRSAQRFPAVVSYLTGITNANQQLFKFITMFSFYQLHALSENSSTVGLYVNFNQNFTLLASVGRSVAILRRNSAAHSPLRFFLSLKYARTLYSLCLPFFDELKMVISSQQRCLLLSSNCNRVEETPDKPHKNIRQNLGYKSSLLYE